VQAEISTKLDVLIALSLRQLLGDTDFSSKGKRKGSGDLVRYLSGMGLSPKDIAGITGSPLTSVRTQLTPTRRK
jgi:hypothetical protein